jgi:flagellar protein FliO/FliZ
VLELTVRLIASLAVVVGLMLLLARVVGKRYGARAGAPVQVVHRQPLSRSASVAVITVGSRVLVVGTTDHQVSLLTELDPEELVEDLDLAADLAEEPDAPEDAAPAALAARGRTSGAGALTGSVLSAQTWRQAIAAATGKTS